MNFGLYIEQQDAIKSFTAEDAEDAEAGPRKPHRGGREKNTSEFNPEFAKTTPREGNGACSV